MSTERSATPVADPATTGRAFSYDALPGRVVFSRGAARTRLLGEIDRLGVERIMLVVTPNERELAAELCRGLADRIVCTFDGVRPHVPVEVAQAARATAQQYQVDALLAVGGGSTTGTAKIVALTEGQPIVAVPTTYAGSEMTPVWGMTTGGAKETGRAQVVQPKVVIYDPDLVQSLPRDMATASALNAMAHCVESVWLSDVPLIMLAALEGVRALASGLRALGADERLATESLLYGAYLAGAAFASAGSGLHHKICHVLGGAFDLPHAATHAVVLPHVLEFNAAAGGECMHRLAEALSAADAVTGLRDLYARVNAPRSLAAIGLAREQLPLATELVAAALPVRNPRPVVPADIDAILTAAFGGEESRA